MLEGGYSFFDFDNTLYKGRSRYLILDFAEFLDGKSCFDPVEKQKIKSLFSSYKKGFITRHDFGVLVVESYYRGLMDIEVKKIQDLAASFWGHIKTEAWFSYTIPLLKILNTATILILISGSPIEILEIINNTLSFNKIYASMGVIKNGIYTGLTWKEMATYTAKADVMESLSKTSSFDPATSFAFGDSESDYPLLNSVCPQNAYMLGAVIGDKTPGKNFGWNYLDQEEEVLNSVNSRIITLFQRDL